MKNTTLIIATLLFLAGNALAATLNVPVPYATIQAAVTAASPGDTIQVAAGSYAVSFANLNKALTFQGAQAGVDARNGRPLASESIITSGGFGVFTLAASGVTFDGFKFSNLKGRTFDASVNADNFAMRNCIVQCATIDASYNTAAIQFNGPVTIHANGLMFERNLVTADNGYLFLMESAMDNGTIRSNKFNGDSVSFGPFGNRTGWVIEGNEFNGNVPGHGAYWGFGFNANLGNVIIRNNSVSQMNIGLGQFSVVGGSITGNTFNDNQYAAFQLWGGEYGTVVSGNVLIQNNTINYNGTTCTGFADASHGIRLRPLGDDPNGIVGSTIHIHNNSFINLGVGTCGQAWAIRNNGNPATAVDATGDWWGTADPIQIAAMLNGPVNFNPWLGAAPGTSPMNWYVSNGGSIQAAVDGASPGDIIHVAAGTYTDLLTIGTPVTLLGANAGIDPRQNCQGGPGRGAESILDGQGTNATVAITTSGVTIDGFTIQNGAFDSYNGGVWMYAGAHSNHILNNIITANTIGISAACDGACSIRTNLITANNVATGPSYGAGIDCYAGDTDLTIADNEFSNHTVGNPILLEATAANEHQRIAIVRNNFHDNPGNSAVYALGIGTGTIASNQITALGATCLSLSGGDADVDVSNNFFSGADRGIRLEGKIYGYLDPSLDTNSNVRVHGNSFSGFTLIAGTQYAVGNETTGYYVGGLLDASANWWGGNAEASVTGVIDTTGGPVDYTPWLDTGVEPAPQVCDGFQGDFHTLHVSAASPQVGSVGRIQEGLNLVSGSTVLVSPGNYSENDVISAKVQLIGSGSGNNPLVDSIITSAAANTPVITITAGGANAGDRLVVQNLRVTGATGGGNSGTGIALTSPGSYYTFDNVVSIGNGGNGMAINFNGNDTDMIISGCSFLNNGEAGFRLPTGGGLDGLTVTGSHFDGNVYGWEVYVNNPATSVFQNVSVSGSTFNNNSSKGVYAEKLSQATFSCCTVSSSGTSGANAAGMDINLKYATYSNILITNTDVSNSGTGDVVNGAGITVKARGTGSDSSYAGNPATLTGVTLANLNVTGCPDGIRFGEPGKHNVGPTGVIVTNCNISGNIVNGIRNESTALTAAENNWWGTITGPFNAANPLGTGNAVVGPVAFSPWLGDGTDTSGACGFQPNSSPVYCLPPTITCPGNITVNTSPGLCSSNVTFTVTANNDCGGLSIVSVPASGSAFSKGTTTVHSTVTDGLGHTAACSFNVTVTDNEAPTITCAPDKTVDADAGQCYASKANVLPLIGTPTTSDNCPGPAVSSNAPAQFPAGATTTITWTVTDAVGHSASCNQNVTVHEHVAPHISFVSDKTVECGSDMSTNVLGWPTNVTDNCDPNPSLTYVDHASVEVTATSPGDWEFSIFHVATAEFVDGPDSPPLPTGSAHLATVDGDAVAELGDSGYQNTLISSLTELSYRSLRTAGSNAQNHSVYLVLTVDNGVDSNVDFLTFEPRYQNGSNPTLPSQGVALDSVWHRWNALIGGWYSYNHPEIASPGAPAPLNAGVQSLSVYLAAYPNAKIVNDGGTGVSLDAGDSVGLWENFDGNADEMIIGTNSVSTAYNFELTPGLDCVATKDHDIIIRTFTATDDSGNSRSSSQTIIVKDTTGPVVTCPANVTIDCAASLNPSNTGMATATDACSGASTPTYSDVTTTGSCAGNYMVARTWSSTDGCGNTGTCVQTITVQDTHAPVIACPANVTIDCTASIDPSNTGTATATDDCSGVASITHSDVTAPGSCAGNYVITRTWLAADNCGNSATCPQTITVQDTHAPVIACPGNVTIDCTASIDPSNTGSATATDDCSGVASITHSDVTAPGSCAGNHVITRTWLAADTCGNSASCAQIITVQDTHAPVIACPSNVTIDCTASIDPSNTGSATATDDCSGVASITHSDVTAPGSCAGNHVITRTWLAADNCGNSASCAQIITVQDTHAPVIACPSNVTIDCTASIDPSNTGSATATDDCSGVASITHSDVTAPGSCAGNYVITRTWLAADNCGNTATCPQIITVQDTHAPVIACPANVTIDCTASIDPSNTGTATATDDCSGVASITHSDVTAPGSCAGNYVITRTWLAADNCGNTATCPQIITVQDTHAPVIACPANVTIDCTASIDPSNTGTATATDDCSGVASISHSDVTAAGSCAGNHVITRTWLAADNCGNTATCPQIITVHDTHPPVIACPGDVTVDCTVDVGNPANTGGSATATDDCSGVASITHSDVTAPGSCAGNHVITRTWLAADNCGNTATCPQIITVQDTHAPVVTAPANVTIDCTASIDPSNTGIATASDNCDPNPTISHTDYSPGEITPGGMGGWTFYTTDSSGVLGTGSGTGAMVNGPAMPPMGTGSAEFQMTGSQSSGSVQLRNTDWTGTRVADLATVQYSTYVKQWNGSQVPYLTLYVNSSGTGSAFDDRIIFEPAYSTSTAGNGNPYPYQPAPALNTWQTWNVLKGMVYTASGLPLKGGSNNGPGSHCITIAAYLAAYPNAKIATSTAGGAGGVRINTGFVSGSIPLDAYVDAVIICAQSLERAYNFELTPGSTCANSVIVRQWQATDSCGNSGYASQLIRVQDTHGPVIACPGNVTIDCTASIDPSNTGSATATDDCSGVASITHSDVTAPGSCAGNYVITRTWLAADNCGNSATCPQTITVQDTHAPVIACPGNVTIDCTASIDPSNTGSATATDDCSGVASITHSDVTAPGSCAGNHVITRTWLAADTCGNSASCAQIITVQDTHAPVIACPSNVTIDCTASIDPSNTGSATATDDCSGVASITHSDVTAPGSCAGNHVITRTWLAADTCGNSASCAQIITVQDTHAPVIACPSNVTIDCTASIDPSNTGSATATDDCSGVASITHSDVTAPGSCAGNHVITRTWLAADTCGNSASCAQIITVQDTHAPVIACPSNVTIDCTASIDPSNTGSATATDDCSGVASITHSDVTAPGSCAGNHVITRTWLAADTCGNSASCAQIITVQDTHAPVIACPSNVTIDCTASIDPSNTGSATATDDCSGVASITHSDVTAPGSCAGNHVITRTWLAADTCGNSASCAQTITVQDTHAPVIACPANVTIDCTASIDPSNTGSATATDDCSGVASITHSDVTAPGSCAGNYVITRTWLAADTCGNSATCPQTITVQDTHGPTVTAGTIAACYPSQAAAEAAALAATTATDDCSGVVSKTALTSGSPCSATIKVTAQDACGNVTPLAFAAVYTTRIDSAPPVVTCPAPITVACTGTGGTVVTFTVTANDNCDPAPVITSTPPSGHHFPEGVTVVTNTAQDSCGNVSAPCFFTVTVTDNVKPTIAIADATVECGPGATDPSNTGTPVLTDNCDPNPQFAVPPYVDASDTEITPTALDGWSLRTSGSGTANFVNGPASPPLATGSLRLALGAGPGTAVGLTTNLDGQFISALTELRYSTYRTNHTGSEAVLLAVSVDLDNNGTADDTLYFEPRYQTGINGTPNQGTVVNATWQTWNALQGAWWSDSGDGGSPGPGVQPLSVYLALHPNAKIAKPAGGGVRLQAGGVTGNWANFDGNVDRFIAGVNSVSITYNFELTPGLDCVSTKIKQIIERTWTAYDAVGNTNSYTQTIVVKDTTGPVVSCPLPVMVSCAGNVPAHATDYATFVVAGGSAVDTCGGPSTVTWVSDVISAQTCPNRYTITRTYEATDACGNTATCAQSITVDDQTAPTITCPPAVTVNCPGNVPPTDFAGGTATDNCPGTVNVVWVGDVISAQTCANRYTITRTYEATDACGNTATCAQSITVDDQTAPVVSCPAATTVNCVGDVPVAATDYAGFVAQGGSTSDGCGGAVAVTFVGDVISAQTCANRYTITRTYEATDACGNTATCAQSITVDDQTAPTITCPPAVTVDCPGNVPPTDFAGGTATDNCPGTVNVVWVGDVISAQTCANRYTITRTYEATDACGNTATCAQSITVDDQTAPVVSCPAATTVNCVGDVPVAATDYAGFVAQGGSTSDGCGGAVAVTFVGDVISGQTCANRYTITRTYRVADVCGNTATCAQSITVDDQTAPTITCPPAVTVDCPGNVPPTDFAGGTATDNCPGTVNVVWVGDVISAQTCANRYTITRTYEATDACGNTATCAQSITVDDQTAPTITCPPAVTVNCPGNVPPTDFAGGTATDNCPGTVNVVWVGDVISAQTCANRYTITRTYEATDACGNTATCAQSITVDDQTAPTITCPPAVTVNCPGNVPPTDFAGGTATDNCPGTVNVVWVGDVISAQTCANRYTITRTYEATDACGNTATCAQSITVDDQTAPTITCPPAVTVNCPGNVPPTDFAGGTATDNCPGTVNVVWVGDVISAQTCPNRYTITRTYEATDACGNTATCAQSITVDDQTAPTITCPPAVTVNCPGNVPLTDFAGGTATDNCPGTVNVVWVGDVISAQTCPNRYTITRTYEATDACGNTATCAQSITVDDQTAPVVSCPAATTVNCVGDVPVAATDYAGFVAQGGSTSDGCGGAVAVTFVGDVISAQTCPNRYTITRTYEATDACGNTATCAQSITVDDQTAPTITCPPAVTVDCPGNVPPTDFAGGTATDNCPGTVNVVWVGDVISAQTCPNRYTITRTYEATDACGNTATCAQSITVDDQTAPTITCPPAVTVDCPGNVPPTDFAGGTATDNCPGTVNVVWVGDVISAQTCANRYTITRTYEATDACGNTATCAQSITVDDQTAPTITCPPAVTVDCPGNVPPTDFAGGTATDNCPGTVNVVWVGDVISAQTCANRYTITRTYEATDACGNTATCAQSITVDDQTAPLLTSGTIGACYLDVQSATNAALAATSATDNCGGPVHLTAVVSGTCSATITVTGTDACGNVSLPVIYNTRIDGLPPVIGTITATEGQPNVVGLVNVLNCNSNTVQGTVNIAVPASDNCSIVGGHPSVTMVNGLNSDAATFVNESPTGVFNYTWAVGPGTANGTWNVTVSASDLCHTVTAPFTLCVDNSQITGQVQLEGFVGTGTSPLHSRIVKFVASTNNPTFGTNVLATWSLLLTNVSGDTFNYTLTGVPLNANHLSAKTAWNLRSSLPLTLVGGQATGENFTGAKQLRGGDLTGDNIVNFSDYSVLGNNWFILNDTLADIVGEGFAGLDSYTVLSDNWFTAGDPQ